MLECRALLATDGFQLQYIGYFGDENCLPTLNMTRSASSLNHMNSQFLADDDSTLKIKTESKSQQLLFKTGHSRST